MAHSKGFSGFSVPEYLLTAPLVEFLVSDSTACSYYETGIILEFVRGYTPSQIKKEKKRRDERNCLWVVVDEYSRSM